MAHNPSFRLLSIASICSAFLASAVTVTDVVAYVFEPLFYTLRWLFKPEPRDLHLVSLTPVSDPIGDARRALPFKAFVARLRSHRLFFGGGIGFVPEWAIA